MGAMEMRRASSRIAGLVAGLGALLCVAQDDFGTSNYAAPTTMEAKGLPDAPEGSAEAKFVEQRLQKAGLAPKQLNCAKAGVANKHACDAYGRHSPICTGAQAQYVLQCGGAKGSDPLMKKLDLGRQFDAFRPGSVDTSMIGLDLDTNMVPLELLQEQEKLLSRGGQSPDEYADQQANIAESQDDSNSTATERTTERTLHTDLEPVLLGCDIEIEKVHVQCKKDVVSGYLEWKDDNSGVSKEKE